MTSNINFAGIDANYPVAGQDNDSQGFRDNFSNIKASLESAKSEITDLQAKAVLKGELTGGAAVDNNLGGGTVYNGFYHNLHGEAYADTIITAGVTSTPIDVSANSAYVFSISDNINFLFTNWPGSSSDHKYAVVRIHLRSENGAAHYATFYSEDAGIFYCEPNVTVDTQSPPHPKVQVSANGKHKVYEVWSVTDGSKVYVQYLGEF